MLILIDTILPNLMASLLVIETSQQASKAYAPSSARDLIMVERSRSARQCLTFRTEPLPVDKRFEDQLVRSYWWRIQESNLPHSACKADALQTELIPLRSDELYKYASF